MRLKIIFFSCLYSRFTCKFREMGYSHKIKLSKYEEQFVLIEVILVKADSFLLPAFRKQIPQKGSLLSMSLRLS